jgi:hypothetical protein
VGAGSAIVKTIPPRSGQRVYLLGAGRNLRWPARGSWL